MMKRAAHLATSVPVLSTPPLLLGLTDVTLLSTPFTYSLMPEQQPPTPGVNVAMTKFHEVVSAIGLSDVVVLRSQLLRPKSCASYPISMSHVRPDAAVDGE